MTRDSLNPVDAIICADLHLSHHAPSAREEKGKEWYEVMERHLDVVNRLCLTINGLAAPTVPLFLAGDIFHKWNSPPEIVSFAIRMLGVNRCYAIPGNHDLPFHRYEDVHKSAFWTLVESCAIKPIGVVAVDDWRFHGFPCGAEVKPLHAGIDKERCKHVAIVHDYIWCKGHSFPNAPTDKHVDEWANKLEGYDYAFFGDNHDAFVVRRGNLVIINCGCMIRRKIDEQAYHPSIWFLRRNGEVERKTLDVASEDRFISNPLKASAELLDTREFIKLLQDMDIESLDFRENLLRMLKNPKLHVTSRCMRIIMSILEDVAR